MLTFNLALGTQVIRADLVPMTTCPPKNMTGDDPLGGKYKTVVWDGSLDSGEFAPAGRYKFVFRALRVYGDESKVEDYYVAESLPFRIEYKSS
ncbi:hypothetical protein ACCO45_011377 [Purpureocillium lilacinum]|uniref:Uncharacterized protein n=2 Tax=Purpureocillium lilacinum TaxID=33203 RepID=A0ACC4DJR6_PURLI